MYVNLIPNGQEPEGGARPRMKGKQDAPAAGRGYCGDRLRWSGCFVYVHVLIVSDTSDASKQVPG